MMKRNKKLKLQNASEQIKNATGIRSSTCNKYYGLTEFLFYGLYFLKTLANMSSFETNCFDRNHVILHIFLRSKHRMGCLKTPASWIGLSIIESII